MSRSQNPINKIIADSVCRFEVALDAIPNSPPLGGRMYERLVSQGVRVNLEQRKFQKLILTASHGLLDGKGGIFCISELLRENRLLVSQSNTLDATGEIQTGDFINKFCWVDNEKKVGGDQSLVQRLVGRISAVYPNVFHKGVALAVGLEQYNEVSDVDLFGNGMTIVSVSHHDLLARSQQTYSSWRNELVQKALRVDEVLRRRKMAGGKFPGTVLLSSLGNIQKSVEGGGFSPKNLNMFSTPTFGDSCNLILWNGASKYSVSVCGDSRHPLVSSFRGLVDIWRVCLNE